MGLIDVDKYLGGVCTYKKTGCGSCKLQTMCPKDAPTVDAVEVVRCKDCVHNQLPPTSGNVNCELWYGMTDLYGYCSRGERKKMEDER